MLYGANVNQGTADNGATPLCIAAEQGYLELVRCLVEELGVDVNQATWDGATPLMAPAYGKHKMVANFLIKHGANPQTSSPRFGTAVDAAQQMGAPVHLIAYLKAKAHCASPGCGGAGLRKCTGCKRARYCGQQCQILHWPAHKIECKQRAEEKAAGQGEVDRITSAFSSALSYNKNE
jgi:hypothetical protein